MRRQRRRKVAPLSDDRFKQERCIYICPFACSYARLRKKKKKKKKKLKRCNALRRAPRHAQLGSPGELQYTAASKFPSIELPIALCVGRLDCMHNKRKRFGSMSARARGGFLSATMCTHVCSMHAALVRAREQLLTTLFNSTRIMHAHHDHVYSRIPKYN